MEPAEIAAITTDPDQFAAVLARHGYTTTVRSEAERGDGSLTVRGRHPDGLCLLVAYDPRARRALRATARAPARRQVSTDLPADVEDFVLAAMSCHCPPCWRWLATWFDPDGAPPPTHRQ